MRILVPALGAVLAGTPLIGTSAPAQTFSGFGPTPTMLLPGAGPVRPPGAPPVPETRAEIRAEARAPSPRRLPAVARSLRLWGETGSVTWPLFVTAAEARAGGRLQVGTLSSISILPESSSLRIGLNGAEIGRAAIDGARGLRLETVTVPPGALRPGFNALTIAVDQRHRVDCTVAATYELWTQIDPDTTGFLSSAEGVANLADLAAIRPRPDGAVPIRLIQTGERLSERRVEGLIAGAQALALAGRFANPAVSFVPSPEAGDGVALAVAPAAELARSLDIAALGPIAGPRLALLPAGPDRRPVVVVTGATETDVTAALAQLDALAAAVPPGTPDGLTALREAGGRRIQGGESLTLADLGLTDQAVTGRTHRLTLDLALPHDLMAADYAKLALDLDATYPAGLAPGAQVSLSINGEAAGSVPLGRPGGESLRRRTVFLPLRLLRPGLNRIELLAALPRAGDQTCAAPAGERLLLRASTRLAIPDLARIARQPDLAATAAAGFPYRAGADGRAPTLVVPAPDRDTMAAAATLATRLGLAAGRTIPFGFDAGRVGIVGPTLVVAAARSLDAPLMKAAGLDPQALRDVWSRREEPVADEVPARDAPAPGPGAAARRRLLRLGAPPGCRGPATPDSRPETLGLPEAALALAQQVTGPAPDDVLTLVTAPNPAALREAVGCLVQPLVWSRPRGRLALLAPDGAAASHLPGTARYVATAPASFGNLRRVAAGWLSLNGGAYALMALACAGLLAASTHRLVRSLGRKTSPGATS
ncbi:MULTISPECIES: cellulose biosynthesis cyclic di-GMP-binding regulatory protein BcsB [Methylobacterium]|uniref:cellulose biosynthesis cyclic di-GMP-binding regulatory protein BcsB n=1 Tax=Methylobacterium TaxID=407 RepID=UPI0013EA41BF|nr:cellulose biosynthesis cyclic di-GMP-binding regulatory protein BcsB [Methylobacterium sp. DB0501]NGM36713.1 cellulose biosynthesis cyclic di-GMP-binding regulatory protein BcsB [Methylobacterium sp. DB0501]